MNRRVLFLIATSATAFLVGVVMFTTNYNHRTALNVTTAPSQPVTPLVQESLPGQYIAQYNRPLSVEDAKIIRDWMVGLQLVASRSSLANEKLKWIKQHGIPAVFSTNGDSIIPTRQPKGVYQIWLIPFGEAKHVGEGDATMAAGYLARLRAVIFTNTKFSRSMRGVLFAHELQHADDNINHGVQMVPNDNDARVIEEREAYKFEHLVLEEYTNGLWSSLVMASIKERSDWKLAKGIPWQGLTFLDFRADSTRIFRTLPQFALSDLGTLSVQLAIDANLRLIDSVSAGDTSIREEGEKTFLRRYFAILQDGRSVR